MRRKSGRTGMVVGAALLVLVAAGALVSGTGSVRDNEAGGGGEAAATDGFAATRQAVNGPSAGGQSAAVAGDAKLIAPTGPRVVRTAEVSVKLGKDGFPAAFDRVAAVATAHGGYVTASSTATAGATDDRRARAGQATLRVPVDRFDDVRRAVGQLGTVEQEASRGEDVSGQLVDYDARLRSLAAQEDALRALVGKAVSVGEVLQVQTALFDVRQQVEQLQGQRAQLDQAASLATLQVSLYEPGAALISVPGPKPATGLAHSFERAVDGAVQVVGGMVVVVGWLTPIAVLGGLVWGGARLARKREGKAAPAAPATG